MKEHFYAKNFGYEIYEIKPFALIAHSTNIEKFKALEYFCKNNSMSCGYITEKTFDIFYIDKNYVDKLILEGKIVLYASDKNLAKYDRMKNESFFCSRSTDW